jgi:hypothetical protein
MNILFSMSKFTSIHIKQFRHLQNHGYNRDFNAIVSPFYDI